MRFEKSFMTILALTAFCSWLLSCKGDEYQIRQEKGVMTIVNRIAQQRELSKDRISFEETLSIGMDSGEENYIFQGSLRGCVDRSRNIYVLDFKACQLSKYDYGGKFLWRIGGKGQGPGEFQSPVDISIGPYGDIHVLDYPNQIEVFSEEGIYKQTLKLNGLFCSIDVMSDGRFLLNELVSEQTGVAAVVYSPEGKYEKRFIDLYLYGPKLSGGGGFSSEKAIRYLNNAIYFSLPDKYEIKKYDLSGNLLMVIKREMTMVPFNIRTDNGVIVNLSIKDRSGPCFLLKDEYIINTCTLYKEEKGRQWYLDIFNNRGIYIGSFMLPKDTNLDCVDEEGNLYFVQRLPYPKIVRMRMSIK